MGAFVPSDLPAFWIIDSGAELLRGLVGFTQKAPSEVFEQSRSCSNKGRIQTFWPTRPNPQGTSHCDLTWMDTLKEIIRQIDPGL